MIDNFWYTGREVERSDLSIIGIPGDTLNRLNTDEQSSLP
jgi:hypothetical protein